MKVALGQMNIISGRCEENFQNLKRQVEEAEKQEVDIIVFPEMCISAYLLQDKFLDDEFCECVHSYNDRIKNLSAHIGIVFGSLYYDTIASLKRGRDGRKARFNCALFAYQKKWVKKENGFLDGIHIKHLNPDYRLFDDSRYFLSGIEVANSLEEKKDALISPFLFKKNGCIHRIALEVCEDLWSQDYNINVSEKYIQQDVDFIINVSCSPYTYNKENARDKVVLKHAMHFKEKMVPILYCGACGMQNSGKNIVLFDGGSCVYGKDGKRIYSLNDNFKEELAIYDFHKSNVLKLNENKILDALTFAIQEVDKQMFNQKVKWIIGLSGGIDSCINACLLVKALGNNRVIAYNMASNYNSDTTKGNARKLADALAIEFCEGSIEMLNAATINTIKEYNYKESYSSLVYENIQARIRGHLLSTFASIEGGVVINNANKIEVALGYCTLYGDSIGAFSPLGDLSKVQLFDVANACNAYFKKEVISKTLIPRIVEGNIQWDMPPSAELKDAQLDPMKWYYHDELIQMIVEYPTARVIHFMSQYLDQTIYDTYIGKWIKYYHLDEPKNFIEDLEWVLNAMSNTVFKRIQMPPILVLSKGAFGNDYRESQLGFIKTPKYNALKKAILEMK